MSGFFLAFMPLVAEGYRRRRVCVHTLNSYDQHAIDCDTCVRHGDREVS